MKRYITTISSILIICFVFSQNIKVDLVDLGENKIKLTLTNISSNHLIIYGISPVDDYGNTYKPTKSYYYLNLYDVNTQQENYRSRLKYLGIHPKSSKYTMFLPMRPGESYDFFEYFYTNMPFEGFFNKNVSGNFDMQAVFHLNIRSISSRTSTKEDITVVSNKIRFETSY